MAQNFFEQFKHWQLIGFLLIFGYFMHMFGNGIISLTHPDEVFYIQSAKEMIKYDSWLTPMIFDRYQFEKPFLSFALFRFAVENFGLTPFVSRFWPALFAIFGVVANYAISYVLFRRKQGAFLAGLILSTSFLYLALSRAVLTDMIFSVTVAFSIGSFALAYYQPRFKQWGLILFFVFAALAVLIKGALGITFPFLMLILFILYKRDYKFILDSAFVLGALIFLLVALPWHSLMIQQYGQAFTLEYWDNVHVRRLFEAEHKRLDNWYFYFALMFAGVLPWSFFWIPSIKHIFVQIKNKLEYRDQILFLLVWILSILVFVQPAKSKLSSYVFPAFAAITILLGHCIDYRLRGNGKNVFAVKVCGYATGIFFVAAMTGGNIAARMFPDIVTDVTPVWISSALLAITIAMIFIFNRTKRYLGMVLSHAGVSITLLAMLFFSVPFIEPWVSCKHICEIFKSIDQSDTPVLSSKFYVRGVRYYTDRPVAVIDINGTGFWSPHPIPFLNTENMVVSFLQQRPVTYAIVKEGNVEDLERIAQRRGITIDHLGGIGGKYILRITTRL